MDAKGVAKKFVKMVRWKIEVKMMQNYGLQKESSQKKGEQERKGEKEKA